MLKGLLAILWLALASLAGAQPGLPAQIDTFMRAWSDTGRFMGSVLIADDGKIVFEGGYGQANVETGTPNTPDTRFRLGSLSKQFTAAVVLRLQQQGMLSVNDPLSEYLPGYPHGEISLRQLLNHSSGIPDYARLPDYPNHMRERTTLGQLIGRFKDLPLLFAPGTQFSYSNSNYVLLSAVIEKVTGKSYAEAVQAMIFGPLGMTDSGYVDARAPAVKEAAGYIFTGGGYAPASYVDMSEVLGAGAIYSTVRDLYTWSQALYGDEFLSAASKNAMFSKSIPAGRSSSGRPAYYGYGWFISELFGRELVSHDGGINGFSSQLLRFPQERVLIVVLSNVDAGPALEVGRGLAAIVFGEPYELPEVRQAVAVDPSTLPRYAGTYLLGPSVAVTVVADGVHLYLASGGRTRFELFAASNTSFFLKNADVSVDFVLSDSGEVLGLVWHQGGRDIPARRVR